MSSRGAKYTPRQVDLYLSRIGLPSISRPTPKNITSDYGLEYLRRLQKYQMQACPFENLNMHYTRDMVKSLEAGDLYKKFVERQWGGTCTENNTFFGNILRTMGFQVRPVGARVNLAIHGGEARYNGWNHCVNIVTFNDQKYLVDVGMGATGSTQPLPLTHMHTASGIGLTTSRLRYDTIPEYTDPTCKLWIYEQDNDGKSVFVPTYCFTELEFLPQDYEIMKLGSTMSRKSWFTYRVVCVRTILEKTSEDVIGVLILSNNILKRRIRGKSEQLATLKNEKERVSVLKEWFGIEMLEEERIGIRGMVTDLGDGIDFQM
jgi:arylamine N-acetyltransferase